MTYSDSACGRFAKSLERREQWCRDYVNKVSEFAKGNDKIAYAVLSVAAHMLSKQGEDRAASAIYGLMETLRAGDKTEVDFSDNARIVDNNFWVLSEKNST